MKTQGEVLNYLN